MTIRQRQLIAPVFGEGPDVIARVAAENPAEMLFTHKVKPGELEMFAGYATRDEFNFDAQTESFAYLARGLGLTVNTIVVPGKHDKQTGMQMLPALRGLPRPAAGPVRPAGLMGGRGRRRGPCLLVGVPGLSRSAADAPAEAGTPTDAGRPTSSRARTTAAAVAAAWGKAARAAAATAASPRRASAIDSSTSSHSSWVRGGSPLAARRALTVRWARSQNRLFFWHPRLSSARSSRYAGPLGRLAQGVVHPGPAPQPQVDGLELNLLVLGPSRACSRVWASWLVSSNRRSRAAW